MENNTKQINDEEPISIIDDNYRFPSCEYPRKMESNSETIDYTRYNTFSKNRDKKVTFNNNVTIVNIQSHKKMVKQQSYQNYDSTGEEDFNEEKEKKCANCNIF